MNIKKTILSFSMIFHGILMTYMIYIYPILKFILKYNPLPYSWWKVFLLSIIGLYFTVKLLEEDI